MIRTNGAAWTLRGSIYTADASDLGFPPGAWPREIEIGLVPFEYFLSRQGHDGDTGFVEYRSVDRRWSAIVFND